MKKFLTATTALALMGGAAAAEITVTGDAKFSLDYNSDPDAGMSKHSFGHEMGVDFAGSGTTDAGLTFGASAGFNTGDETVNVGSVYIEGSFGKASFGDVARASDLAGGIADVGLNGIGVDDVVEDLRETSAKQFRYDNTFGNITIAVSAGTTDGSVAVEAKPGIWSYGDTGLTSINALTSGDAYDVWLGRAVVDNTLLPGAPATGTDPLAVFKAALGFEVVRTAAKDNNPATLTVSLDGSPADANRHNILGYKRGAGTAVLDSDGQPEATTEVQNAFNAYAEVFDLGADGAVGGGDDMPKEDYLALLSNIVEPVEAADAVAADNQYAFGMSFNASGVTVGIGYDSEKTVSMGVGFATGDISTNTLYVRTDDDTTGTGLDVSYTIDASTLTLAYARSKPDMGTATDAMGINVSHDLGGGATMVAGFGQVDDVNHASAGISFKF